MKYYAKFKSPDGSYVDGIGLRYDVSTVRRVRNADGVNVGYSLFPSLEEALEKWKLVALTSTEAASQTAAEYR